MSCGQFTPNIWDIFGTVYLEIYIWGEALGYLGWSHLRANIIGEFFGRGWRALGEKFLPLNPSTPPPKPLYSLLYLYNIETSFLCTNIFKDC